MKKFFLLLALILIFSVTACGKKSENTTTPEQNDADETAETELNDDDINTDSDSDSDFEYDKDAVENDEDDDTDPDTDQNDGDTEIPVYPDSDLPECSPESGTPCKDSVTGLVWSTKLFDNWKALKCTELSEGGFTDWRRPTISQLRTLIQNCPNTETGSECLIYEYLDEKCDKKCSACNKIDTGEYSKFGDTEIFWSSTLCSEFYVVNFSNGAIYGSCNYDDAFWGEFSGQIPPADCTGYFLRCTRCYEGYFWYEDKCIESPCNSNPCGEIPHIRCVPLSKTNYRCICEDGYYLNGEECVSY